MRPTLWSFLRRFTFGRVRQLDASRFLAALTGLFWLLGNPNSRTKAQSMR